MVGEFVEVTIEGREFTDVVRLDRDHVRDRDTVWTMHDGKLQVSEVEVLMRDAQYAYIGNGLESGDKVVTTHISRVKEGAPLRLKDER